MVMLFFHKSFMLARAERVLGSKAVNATLSTRAAINFIVRSSFDLWNTFYSLIYSKLFALTYLLRIQPKQNKGPAFKPLIF